MDTNWVNAVFFYVVKMLAGSKIKLKSRTLAMSAIGYICKHYMIRLRIATTCNVRKHELPCCLDTVACKDDELDQSLEAADGPLTGVRSTSLRSSSRRFDPSL